MKDAMFWEPAKDKKVQCKLCPHNCIIADGKKGICRARKNKSGTLYTILYGLTSQGAVDPIEKKPLYHFYPGSYVYSFGMLGCNLKCQHCQNYFTSQSEPSENSVREISPKAAVAGAPENGCKGVAWTYNEPTISFEYNYEGSQYAKELGLYTVYVTNGYINPEPLKKIAPYLNAMNIDIKAFTENFYKEICKAKLEPVLKTCELAKELGIHIELTTLIIPTFNDDLTELQNLCKWVVKKLGDRVPMHFSRFHPDYNLRDVPATPEETLLAAYDIAKKEGLKYVYLGNIQLPEHNNTYCPKCNTLVINRTEGFFGKIKNYLNAGKCQKCNELILKYF